MPTETVRQDKRQRPLRDIATNALVLTKLTVAPVTPYNGMIVYADGTSWNPGSGEGYYGYYNSTWNKLG